MLRGAKLNRLLKALPCRQLSSAPTVNVDISSMQQGPLGNHRAPLPPNYQLDARLLETNPTHVTSLSNGLTVASEKTNSNVVTVGVHIGTGSRDDPASASGTAHFLEHLSFKGTGKRSQRDIEYEAEKNGAVLNAYTSRETTSYFLTVPKQNLEWATDYVSDILLNSQYDAAAVERERSVILREMQEVNADSSEYIFDMLHGTAFDGQALGRTILGAVENVQTIRRDDITSFVQANYTAPRMNVVVTGDIEHAQAEDLSNKYFGGVRSEPSAPVTTRDKALYIGSDVRERWDDMDRISMAIGFESLPVDHADSVALMVMNTILGAWESNSLVGTNSTSSLARIVAENELADSFSTFNTMYSDTGLFGIFGITTPDKVSDFTWAAEREMVNLCHTVSDEAVDRAVAQLKANFLAQYAASSSLNEDIGRQLMTYGRRVPLPELFARLDGVDAATVKRVANGIINDRDHVCASKGPVANVPDYNWMRRRTYMLRY